ncbi:MAG TPA: hypothetical protein PKJ05_03375 [Bacillota bacterium]|nr:hypothetical protein [Bacillota bacterium]
MRHRFSGRAALILLIIIFAGLLQTGCKKDMKIILFSDTDNGFIQEALEKMNYAYVPCYTMLDFYYNFIDDAWDLVIFDNRQPSPIPGAEEEILNNVYLYALMGGKVLINSMYLNNYPAIWAYFGYSYVSSSTVPISVYRINPTGEFWNEPEAAPDMILSGAPDPYGSATNAFKGAAVMSGIKMATFNQSIPGDLNSGAVFKANAGRTILNAFFLDDAVAAGVPIDGDSDGTADAVEWYMNELFSLEQAAGKRVQPQSNPQN